MKSIFGHRAKHKKFNYKYRYYDPEKDKTRRERLKIERSHKKYHHKRSVLLYALGLALVVYLIYII